jgi:CBS domain-containing protein
MNIRQIMSHQVWTCRPDDSLAHVAQLMWDHDCGCVPVVNAEGQATAMITDRDICMAAYTQGRKLDEMSVASAASHGLVAVSEDDSLELAETLMQRHQVRRMPVLDGSAIPIGIVSMNDFAMHAHRTSFHSDGLSPQQVVQTLAAVGRPLHETNHSAE